MNCCSNTNNSTSDSNNKDKKCKMTFNHNVPYMGVLMILLDYLLMNVYAFTTDADFQHNKHIIIINYGISNFEIQK
jgi:hypothetical protein